MAILEIGIIFLALALGIKHSFDADHLIAVSTYLTRARKIRPAIKTGMYWATGHMITASIITFLLFTFKEVFLVKYLSGFESLVAIMLIVLGIFAFKDVRKFHSHSHRHEGVEHSHPHAHDAADHAHKHMLGVGVVHGLASNDELLILLTAEIGLTSLFGMLVGVLLFSVGVVAGMTLFSILVTYSVTKYANRIQYAVIAASGLLSIAYGVLMLAGI